MVDKQKQKPFKDAFVAPGGNRMDMSLVEPIAQYVVGIFVIAGLGWMVDRWGKVLLKGSGGSPPEDSTGHPASHRIWMLVTGVMAGFTCAFILKYGVHIDTGSVVLFWVMLVLATCSGGIVVYFVSPWLERRKLFLWLRFLLAFVIGFIGSIIGCLLIPIAIYVIVTSPRLIDDLKGEDWD